MSPWLVIGTFYLSLFLAISKRIYDKKISPESRKNLKKYDAQFLEWTLILFGGLILLFFDLYIFMNYKGKLYFLALFPSTFLILRYFYILRVNPEIGGNLTKLLKYPDFVVGALFLVALLFFLHNFY